MSLNLRATWCASVRVSFTVPVSYDGKLIGSDLHTAWRCRHGHARPETAVACASEELDAMARREKEARLRALLEKGEGV